MQSPCPSGGVQSIIWVTRLLTSSSGFGPSNGNLQYDLHPPGESLQTGICSTICTPLGRKVRFAPPPFGVREQKRHVKERVKFLKPFWMAWVSSLVHLAGVLAKMPLFCQFSKVINRKSLRTLFVPPGVPRTPGWCPQDFSYVCAHVGKGGLFRRTTRAKLWGRAKHKFRCSQSK